jgi:hypothetical protein
MYFGIPTDDLACVPCVPALLSAAEMVLPVSMPIAGSFVHFSVCLCNNHFADHPSTPQNDAAYLKLRDLSKTAPLPSAKEIEQFGDSLFAYSSDSPLAPRLVSLVYLCYAATSMFADLTPKVKNKLRRVEADVTGQASHVPAALMQSAVLQPPAPSKAAQLIQIAATALHHRRDAVAYAAILAGIRALEAEMR